MWVEGFSLQTHDSMQIIEFLYRRFILNNDNVGGYIFGICGQDDFNIQLFTLCTDDSSFVVVIFFSLFSSKMQLWYLNKAGTCIIFTLEIILCIRVGSFFLILFKLCGIPDEIFKNKLK